MSIVKKQPYYLLKNAASSNNVPRKKPPSTRWKKMINYDQKRREIKRKREKQKKEKIGHVEVEKKKKKRCLKKMHKSRSNYFKSGKGASTMTIGYRRMNRHIRRMILHNQKKYARILDPVDKFGNTKWSVEHLYVQTMQAAANTMLEKIITRSADVSQHRQLGRSKVKNTTEKVETVRRLQLMEHDLNLAWNTIRTDARRR